MARVFPIYSSSTNQKQLKTRSYFMTTNRLAVGATGLIISLLFFASDIFAETAADGGNRFNIERAYNSEISAAKAYLLTEGDEYEHRKHRYGPKHHEKVIIIDVRSIEEYVVGHPDDAYNIPYPNIYGAPYATEGRAVIKQAAIDFFNYVAEQFPDRDTPILTLCRTGKRSVWAANILANPMEWIPKRGGTIPEGVVLEGYSNVRNIWEGFEGKYKWDDTLAVALDLNNDGELTPMNNAVMEQNPDRDGWWNYQELPFSTELELEHLYGANNGELIPLYFQE
jgi:rhodanese-related sulfurtransferase